MVMALRRDLLPVNPPIFDATAKSIQLQTKAIIEQTRQAQRQICSTVTPGHATFDNTIRPLIDDNNQRKRDSFVLVFYQQVSTNADVRAASRDAEEIFNEQDIESYSQSDLFERVAAVHNNNQNTDVLPESRRWLEREYRLFLANGLELTSKHQARLQHLRKEINQRTVDFNKCIAEQDGCLRLNRDELDGVPDDTIEGFEQCDGKYKVTFQGPDVGAVMSYAKDAAVRQRLYVANTNKCTSNVARLRDVLIMRDEAARLLGYANHAEFRLQEKMEKSPERVTRFLTDLRDKLADRGREELNRLIDLKKQDYVSQQKPFDGRYYLWDHAYYSRLLLQKECQIDREKVAEYFPLSHTLDSMLEIFEELFGIKFYQVDHASFPERLVWHDDVQMYSVWDDIDDNEFLGYFYLDLYPRKGKFGHFANFTLRPGYTNADGTRSHPVTALVCNFSKPTKTKPSLLKHGDVWMLFHELGHGIHDLVSKTQHARFHGTQTVQDFCEAPSQMLENWCWTYSSLRRLSRHYSRLSPDSSIGGEEMPERIPQDMLDKLIQTKQVNQALFYHQSLYVSTFDMAVHSFSTHEEAQKVNPSYMWNRLQTEVIGVSGMDALGEGFEWGHGEANFGHLMGDYDAGYYGYLSSQVYAFDMFYTNFKADPMNKVEGRRYRRMILEKGGSMDELEMLRAYLGREPNADAFYQDLGITVPTTHSEL